MNFLSFRLSTYMSPIYLTFVCLTNYLSFCLAVCRRRKSFFTATFWQQA